MGLDGVQRDIQLGRNLWVGQPFGDKFEDLLVSRSIRHKGAIMFSVLALHDQKEQGQATQFIGKGPDFISFGAKFAKQAFQ